MNDIRKKHTGEPGNGGQFGSKANTESAVVLTEQPTAREARLARVQNAHSEIDRLHEQFALDIIREKAKSILNPGATSAVVWSGIAEYQNADGAPVYAKWAGGCDALDQYTAHLPDGEYNLTPRPDERITEITRVVENQFADSRSVREYASEAIRLTVREEYPDAVNLVLADEGEFALRLVPRAVEGSGSVLVDYEESGGDGTFDELSEWTSLLDTDLDAIAERDANGALTGRSVLEL